jgi:hypothetical protein
VRAITSYTDDELRDIIRREQSASANRAAGSGNGVAEPPDSTSVQKGPRQGRRGPVVACVCGVRAIGSLGCYMLSGPGTTGDGAYIYTRAADRITNSLLNAELSGKIFGGVHETWIEFQRRVARFVEWKGGKAEVLPPYSARHDWGKCESFTSPALNGFQGWPRTWKR